MKLSLLGSTGSIGQNTLQVIREMPEEVDVAALTAGKNVAVLLDQAREFKPGLVSLADEASAQLFRDGWTSADGPCPRVLYGAEGNMAAVTEAEPETLVSAAVGVAGLPATFEAVRRGLRVALANKEVLVAAGELVMAETRRSGAELLPVDSEHNGVHQCLRAGRNDEVDRILITASGGPFRTTPSSEFDSVTPEQALNHPTWKMGARITIDSATLMNKGFEVIEACRLFDFGTDRVQVVVHPQSIVHAMVEYCDGSVIAQLCPPDMKMPIRYALSYPRREAGLMERRLAWDRVRQLDFEPPDFRKFPLLRLAYDSVDAGGAAGAVLNAADEVAVEAFLAGRLPFPGIWAVVEETLTKLSGARAESIEETLAHDREARAVAREWVEQRAVGVA